MVVAVAFALAYEGTGGSGRWELPNLSGLAGDRAYLLLVGAGLFVGATIFSMLGYVILYVEDVVGAGAAAGGVVLALTQAAGSAGRVGAGSLADRLDAESYYLDEYGHVQSVDQLLALDGGLQRGLVEPGDLVCLLAAGTGYTWAARVLEWHG